MNIRPIQTNFITGILSPRFWARSDTAEYRAGVQDCENMITTRHGPIQSRNGTVFLTDLDTTYARPFGFQLIPNSVTGEAFNAIALADGTLRLFGATGTLYQQELNNNDFSISLDGWNKQFVAGKSTVEWSSGAAILTPELVRLGASAGITQEVTVPVGSENDDRQVSFLSILLGGNVPSTTTINFGTTEGASDLGSHSTISSALEVTFNPGGLTSYWISFSCQNTGFTSPPLGEEEPETYGYRKILSVSSSLTISGAIEFSHPWSESDIQNLHAEMSPNENSMYFVCQNVEPHKLSFDLATNVWSFAPVAFTSAPASWVAGSYPTTMGFFQGRSWWAGVESKPQTFWGSKPNNESTATNELEDLAIGPLAGDALEFSLSRSGRIRWIEGAINLVIGTTSGEFLINGSSGIITPDDILVSQQSAEGGDSVNAKQVGNMVLFVSGDGRKLLGTRYFEDQNQWRAQELSFTAENLTEGKKIIQIAYARNPESIIWCLLDDGSLIGCTYDPFNNSLGWHKHTIANIKGISVVEKAGFSLLSATVERNIDGQPAIYLEELGQDYMDSSVVLQTTSTAISVPHLAGETVVIKINDAQHPDITLDTSGNGTLEYFSETASIGLEMPISVTTLEPDFGSQGGTSMGFNKRYVDITARIYDSAIPLVNGERPPVRFPNTPMGYREPNKTTDVSVKSLGHNNGGVTVTQSLPYKLTLVGLFGKLEQNKL